MSTQDLETPFSNGNNYFYSLKENCLKQHTTPEKEITLSTDFVTKQFDINPTNNQVAFAKDDKTIVVSNIDDNGIQKEIELHGCNPTFGSDGVLYYMKNAEIWAYSKDKNEKIFEDSDATMKHYVTKSRRFLVAVKEFDNCNENYILDLSNAGAEFKLFTAKQNGIWYRLSHQENKWYILTNRDEAVNGKVMCAELDATDNWENVFDYCENVHIRKVECFKSFIALFVKVNDDYFLWIYKDGQMTPVPNIDVSSDCILHDSINKDYNFPYIRYVSESKSGQTVLEYDSASRNYTIISYKKI